MKKILSILSLSILFFSFQSSDDTGNIINALKQGKAEVLSKYFDNMIDLKLPEKDELKNISKNQAAITMENFFNTIGVQGFEVISQGDRGGTLYVTGKLQGKEKTYNLALMMKSKGSSPQIITVRVN